MDEVTEVRESNIMRDLITCTLSEVKEDKMSRECSMHGTEDECMQSIG
jgi:hypothetical protein